jgi:hypothetical protein
MGNKKINKKYALSYNKHINLKPTCEPRELLMCRPYALGHVKNVNTMFVDEAQAIKKFIKSIDCHIINI